MWVKIAGAWTDVGPAGDLSAYAQKAAANTFTEDQTIEADNALKLSDVSTFIGRSSGAGGAPVWSRNASWNGSAWVRQVADNDASQIWMESNGDLSFYTNSDAGNTVGSTITWAEKFRITKGGNLTTEGWAWAKNGLYPGPAVGDRVIRTVTGSPEGVVTAPVGSMALRTDGAAGTTLYVKESGTGNTGWKAIGGGGMKLLGHKRYAPTTDTTLNTTSGTLAALDTTNLRVSFVAPASGKVKFKVQASFHPSTSAAHMTIGVLSGATVVAAKYFYCSGSTADASEFTIIAGMPNWREWEVLVPGLTPGTTYNFDLAMAAPNGGTMGLKIGEGDSSQGEAPAILEVWEVPA